MKAAVCVIFKIFCVLIKWKFHPLNKMATSGQKTYKSPVFAVFPFEEPDVFHYPKPDYSNCDQTFMDAIK